MPNGKILTVLAILAVAVASAQTAWSQEAPPERQEAPAEVEKTGTQPPPAGEEGQEPPPSQERRGQKPGGLLGGMWPLWLMLGGFFLLYMWMGRGRRKEQRRRQEMLSSLRKGDKITTIGGVVGTVMEVRDDEITVKVDESGNVRMKFARWAIRGVGDLAKVESPAQAAKQQQQSGRR
jgi:preprotein translocase subunit YajC